MKIADLYVLAYADADGNITSYPKGGGSSTKPSIKAYDSLDSARRGQRFVGGRIIRVTGAEVVE